MTGFGHLFDDFTDTADRLECVQLGPADPSFEAWRQGLARPERSVRTSPWLARMVRTVTDPVAPKQWRRVRLVEWPLNDYTRWELLGFVESQACGEQLYLLDRDRLDYEGPDLWVFDARTDHAAVGTLHYGADGSVERRGLETDPGWIVEARRVFETALALATPLNEWLARTADARA